MTLVEATVDNQDLSHDEWLRLQRTDFQTRVEALQRDHFQNRDVVEDAPVVSDEHELHARQIWLTQGKPPLVQRQTAFHKMTD